MPFGRDAALLLIDIQKGFDQADHWGPRNNPDAEANAGRLLDAFRAAELPVFHVRHMSTSPESPLRPGLPGNEIHSRVAPSGDEPVVEKNVNSAFIGTDLQQRLEAGGIRSLVVAGITTNHCVSTSVRMAANLGFVTILVEDACATFDGKAPDGRTIPAAVMHDIGIAELNGEFAEIVRTDDLLARIG
jgi:nicotinamidase-related amidase